MRLLVHVGHDKTGSSFMQANLARNSEYLQTKGIYYPVMNEEERNPHISSGNGYLLSQGALPQPPQGTEIYLISAEQLYRSLVNDERILGNLIASAEALGASSIEFILYVRDPIDHAESAFQQSVKRGGGTDTPEDFFKIYRTPQLVVRFKKKLDTMALAKLHIFNYSRYSRDALKPILELIGVDTLPVDDSLKTRINRSLTRDEFEFQRSLNTVLGREAAFLSDALCNTLPNVKSDKIYPSADAQEAMISRLSQYLDEIDTILAPEEKYTRTTRVAEASPEELCFSLGQTETIARSMAIQIRAYKYEADFAKARLNLQQARLSKDPERSRAFAETALKFLNGMNETDQDTPKLRALLRNATELKATVDAFLEGLTT